MIRAAEDVGHGSLTRVTWDWESLSAVIRKLKMPSEHYAVGPSGYALSRDRSAKATRIEVLVDEVGWKKLKERGWLEVGRHGLRHPSNADCAPAWPHWTTYASTCTGGRHPSDCRGA